MKKPGLIFSFKKFFLEFWGWYQEMGKLNASLDPSLRPPAIGSRPHQFFVFPRPPPSTAPPSSTALHSSPLLSRAPPLFSPKPGSPTNIEPYENEAQLVSN